MNEKHLKSFIINYISQKESENSEFIRYSFYELKVKYNLTEEEIDELLRINRDYFENKGYSVFFTGMRYTYKNAIQTVQPNELLIAFKN